MTRQESPVLQLTLTQWQQRSLLWTVTWFFLAAGIMLGWLAALLVAASRSGNGVFGVDGSSVSLVLIVNGLVFVCIVVGACAAFANQSKVSRTVREALEIAPASEPMASAVLIRAALARRESDAHQLLYAAHPEGEPVRPVIVPVRQGDSLPEPGTGAWLMINRQMPAFASFFNTAPEQHAVALGDPAFEKLSKVQRGLAVPWSTYLVPALIGVVVLLVSLVGFSVVLGTFG